MTETEIINTIKKACDNRKACEAILMGEPSGRIIHPHGICNTRRLEPVIVCVQVGGYSSKPKELPQFRNLSLDKCEEVVILEKKFRVDQNFNPDDEQYRDWLFHV
jgi:hypothetical protein